MNKAAKEYVIQFGASMLAYAVILIVSVLLLRNISEPIWWVVIAVLPVIPTILGMVALLRFMNRMDELQRRIQLQAIGFASAAIGMLTFTYGFLENIGFPHLPTLWIFPMLIMLWGIGVAVAVRRYR